jgi:hypothetical protein
VVDPCPARALDHDQVRLVQHAQVIHHAEPRHLWVCSAELAGRRRPLMQLVEQRPTGRIGERLEDDVMLIHM